MSEIDRIVLQRDARERAAAERRREQEAAAEQAAASALAAQIRAGSQTALRFLSENCVDRAVVVSWAEPGFFKNRVIERAGWAVYSFETISRVQDSEIRRTATVWLVSDGRLAISTQGPTACLLVELDKLIEHHRIGAEGLNRSLATVPTRFSG